jgi:hypothetical protein
MCIHKFHRILTGSPQDGNIIVCGSLIFMVKFLVAACHFILQVDEFVELTLS